ncbi:MAG TPA: transcriptional regulator [Desulfobacterales bacterium]|nr:transcriptional regulator [Desulfobacterales bacterium]
MARGDQLGRQWQIIQHLIRVRGGVGAAELARRLDCHVRTIYRDLEALQVGGFPIYNDRRDGRNRWALLETRQDQTPIPLTARELFALYLSKSVLTPLKTTFFYDALESFFNKIRATLKPSQLAHLEAISQTFQTGFEPYRDYGAHRAALETITAAAIRKHCVRLDYAAMGRKTRSQRVVAPYKIWHLRGAIYIVGFCHLRQDVRIFALNRIQAVEKTEEAFEVPDDFDLTAFMGGGCGAFAGKPVTLRVWFAERIAGYIEERTWHPGQRIRRNPDGSIVYEAETALTAETRAWVLGWGAAARVLGPERLAAEIKAEAEQMAAAYRRS